MLGAWRRFGEEKPKGNKAFGYLNGRRGILVLEKDGWEFISGSPIDRITIYHEELLENILFMDDFRGKNR